MTILSVQSLNNKNAFSRIKILIIFAEQKKFGDDLKITQNLGGHV